MCARLTLAAALALPAFAGPDDVYVRGAKTIDATLSRVETLKQEVYIRMEGTTFGNVPLNVEVKLEVWDSPNSAGVMIDAIRCAKLALDRELAGPIIGPSSYFFKTPPRQFRDEICREKVEDFISGENEE